MLRQDDYIKSQLVTLGWFHGKEYGGYLPACMIMSCVANRVRLGGGSWLEVIDRIPKTSATYTQPTGMVNIWEAGFVRLLHEVEGIYDNSTKDLSNGGLYWCDLRRVETDWFRDEILRKPDQHPRTAECNSLVCFR